MFEQLASAKRAALYTDRRLLFDQIAEGLEAAQIPYGKRASGIRPQLLKDIQLCMVQTEASQGLKKGRPVHQADLVLIDEAHKNGGASMQQLYDLHLKANPEAILVGYTATPLGIGHMYDELISVADVATLRERGVLVPAIHFAPDEPDARLVGKVKTDGGECGIEQAKRDAYVHQVFGRVIDQYREINPEQRPTILFAPGVKESLWFAKELSAAGIPAAHIDGQSSWVDGMEYSSDSEIRDEILDRLEEGDIKIVCNRFVLREGIDRRIVSHAIFATVFGSLTSYIQAGGRVLRGAEGKEFATIQDHGANYIRHGSLNEVRHWLLEDDDRVVAGVRAEKFRDKLQQEPIVCPNCGAVRSRGDTCFNCSEVSTMKIRKVLQADGTLKQVTTDFYKPIRLAKKDPNLEAEWIKRANMIRNSRKPTVQRMTFNQLRVRLAEDHGWKYPPKDMPGMPVHDRDWFKRIKDVPPERLR